MAPRSKKPKRAHAERHGGPPGDPAQINEELLAAYMAGTLSVNQRLEVAQYLATSPEAREVLSMAYAAMLAERRSSAP